MIITNLLLNDKRYNDKKIINDNIIIKIELEKERSKRLISIKLCILNCSKGL